MLNGTQVTVIGNLGSEPDMRYTPGGNAVASFSVAVPQRRYDKVSGKWEDTGTTWYRCIAWRDLAEHAAESLTRGTRVIVVGSLASRDWEDKEGNKRESWEVTVDAIGPDLTYATASVKRTTREKVPMPEDPYASEQTGSEATT
jgi:single-strand DNA-binding protein